MISAPGKLVLAGEYAVLDGYPGLAMAVNRRVTLEPSKQISRSHLWEAVSQNQRPPRFKINSSALYEGHKKLGLGSSAATAVCMAAFLNPADIYRCAFEGHRRFSGGLGSGIDVAASFYGGLLRFQNGNATPLKPHFDPQTLLCVFAKKSQNTRAFLTRVLDFKAKAPKEYAQLMAHLGALSARWEAIYTRDYTWPMLGDLVGENLTLLEELAKKSGIHWLTEEQAHIAQITQRHEGYAKPSGAGGGDVTLCFVQPKNRQALKQDLSTAGFLPLDLDYFAPGLLVGPESSTQIQ